MVDETYKAWSPEDLFSKGIELFNDEEYFECHEVLEALWNMQAEPEKQFTQGIIQIAVGLYHTGRDNFVGARKLLDRGLNRVRPFAPAHRGLAIATFVDEVSSFRALLDHEPSQSGMKEKARPRLERSK